MPGVSRSNAYLGLINANMIDVNWSVVSVLTVQQCNSWMPRLDGVLHDRYIVATDRAGASSGVWCMVRGALIVCGARHTCCLTYDSWSGVRCVFWYMGLMAIYLFYLC